MRARTGIGLAVVLALALAEIRFLFPEEESAVLVATAFLVGALAGLGLARWVPASAVIPVGGVGLVLFYPLILAALAATVLTGTLYETVAYPVVVVLLAAPVAVAVLVACRLAEGLGLPSRAALAAGTAVGLALAFAVSAPGADWLHEPPPARYAEIDDVRGAYGPVALGDTRAALFAAFGPTERASLEEPLSPIGAGDEFEGPNFVPMNAEPEIYRYEDASFWFENGQVTGFELTSPGARTSRGIGVGSDLAAVREAYPELECGDAPAGDIATYPYCAGRLGPGRWVWFGGDPVSNITFTSAGFE
ncbi:MAG TPA: hypothetical protein VD769_02065 [Gaiellaceae bacterium]|nr:hypothetical protein [Gaiellaceae bacterium]